jgi:hypothetical protein
MGIISLLHTYTNELLNYSQTLNSTCWAYVISCFVALSMKTKLVMNENNNNKGWATSINVRSTCNCVSEDCVVKSIHYYYIIDTFDTGELVLTLFEFWQIHHQLSLISEQSCLFMKRSLSKNNNQTTICSLWSVGGEGRKLMASSLYLS